MGLVDRAKHAWNAFFNKDPTHTNWDTGSSYYYRPDRPRFVGGSERSIVTSVLNRIAMDAAAIDIEHVRLDENDRFIETLKTGLNECLTTEANIDQSGRAFLQDVYMNTLDKGVVAIVPTDTTANPNITSSYDILTMRAGKILEWRPQSVQVKVYNENTGEAEDIWLKKRNVGIVENPLYAVINERNSTMQRLIRKLALLDAVDEQSSSGKLDMIIQLPYTIKTEARRQQAEQRRADIEKQLSGNKLGIAYTDGTEKVIQLNRPLENNLLKQVEYLTSMLYSQLGITQAIMDGTASEEAMLNYYSRTIEPLVSAVADELKRKFLSKTARSQKQSIAYFRDVFSLVPATKIAEIADTLTRNEISTSNEMRQVFGWKPSSDPRADELRNKNISASKDSYYDNPKPKPTENSEGGENSKWDMKD